jgi:hypothetical protein
VSVRADEVRVLESQLLRLGVHQRHEPRAAPASDVEGERLRGVVGALDQGRLDEIVDGDPLARPQVDGRSAGSRGGFGHGDDVVEPGVLERHEHRHQLRDARDRQPLLLVVREQDLAGGAVLDEPRAGVDPRRRTLGDPGERERHQQSQEPEPHGAQAYLRGYCTRMRCPTDSATGSISGFSSRSA